MSNDSKKPNEEIIEGEVIEPHSLVVASDYSAELSVEQAVKRYNKMKKFVQEVMEEGRDFGTIPGTPKPTLYKPGAEKLTSLFEMSVRFIEERTIERWDDDNPLFFYLRKCQLWRGDLLIAEASGSANSKESRYRWRWVREDEIPGNLDKADLKTRGGFEGLWAFAYDKRETSGKYGKPESYYAHIDKCLADGTARKIQKPQSWKNGEPGEFIEFPNMEYRIPNEDIFTLTNTILKMAEKRALVAATLIGCNASEFFTQDLEDIGSAGGDENGEKVKTIEPPVANLTPTEMLKALWEIANNYRKDGGAMQPDKLKSFIIRLTNVMKKMNQFSATEKQRQLLIGMLSPMFDGNEIDRHLFLEWLTGQKSTKELEGTVVNALLAWMELTSEKDGGNYVPSEAALKEAKLALREAMKASGQTEMPGEA